MSIPFNTTKPIRDRQFTHSGPYLEKHKLKRIKFKNAIKCQYFKMNDNVVLKNILCFFAPFDQLIF